MTMHILNRHIYLNHVRVERTTGGNGIEKEAILYWKVTHVPHLEDAVCDWLPTQSADLTFAISKDQWFDTRGFSSATTELLSRHWRRGIRNPKVAA